MFKFIETFQQRRQLRNLERLYHIECNDLASFKSALPRAIRKGDDSLSTALRNTITTTQAECSKLRNKIIAIQSILKETDVSAGG